MNQVKQWEGSRTNLNLPYKEMGSDLTITIHKWTNKVTRKDSARSSSPQIKLIQELPVQRELQ